MAHASAGSRMSLMVGGRGQLSNPSTGVKIERSGLEKGKLTKILVALQKPMCPIDVCQEGRTKVKLKEPRQRQIRLTESQIDDLVRDRALGCTINHLADVYGIHRTTVMGHLKRRRGSVPLPEG